MALPTNYTDATWTGNRKYKMTTNSDGTVSFEDVTSYTNKENSFFGAADANAMNAAVNELNTNLTGNYVYVGSNSVAMSFGMVAADTSASASATFTDSTGATAFIPVCTTNGWVVLNGITVSKSGTTVTVSGTGWNFSSGSHSGSHTVIVHKFKKIS